LLALYNDVKDDHLLELAVSLLGEVQAWASFPVR